MPAAGVAAGERWSSSSTVDRAARTVSEVTLYITLSAAALAIIVGALVKLALVRMARRRRSRSSDRTT